MTTRASSATTRGVRVDKEVLARMALASGGCLHLPSFPNWNSKMQKGGGDEKRKKAWRGKVFL